MSMMRDYTNPNNNEQRRRDAIGRLVQLQQARERFDEYQGAYEYQKKKSEEAKHVRKMEEEERRMIEQKYLDDTSMQTSVAEGAAMGSAAGPWGMLVGAIIGTGMGMAKSMDATSKKTGKAVDAEDFFGTLLEAGSASTYNPRTGGAGTLITNPEATERAAKMAMGATAKSGIMDSFGEDEDLGPTGDMTQKEIMDYRSSLKKGEEGFGGQAAGQTQGSRYADHQADMARQRGQNQAGTPQAAQAPLQMPSANADPDVISGQYGFTGNGVDALTGARKNDKSRYGY